MSVTWQPNLFFGSGYDSVRGEPKQKAVTGTPVAPQNAAGQIGDSNLIIIQSSEEFNSAMSVGAELDVSFGLFSGSAKFDYKERCKVSSQATFCMIRVLALNAYERLDDPKLTDEAAELLLNRNEKRFRERFGDLFVSGQTAGVEFFGSVRIEAKQKERQMELAAKVQASYGLMASGQVSTSFNESMQSSEHRMEITTYQKGGSINVCVDIVQLFQQAQKALDEGRAGRGYPFGVEVDPFTELRLPNDDASFIDVEFARRSLKRLSGHVQALEQLSNDIDFVLRNQPWFESPDVVGLNAANRAIANELNNVREQANICSRDFAECKAYEPAYPEIHIPPRIVVAASAPAQPQVAEPMPTQPGKLGELRNRFEEGVRIRPERIGGG